MIAEKEEEVTELKLESQNFQLQWKEQKKRNKHLVKTVAELKKKIA